jgi:hypothetical protein
MRSHVLSGVRLTILTVILQGVLFCQCGSGLHAGLQAQLLPPGFSDEQQQVQLSFLLLNDSGTPLNVHADSWKIVVNGRELDGSQWIFGNGPGPVGGYRILKPGDHYEFGKQLPVIGYFPSPGVYTVAWKGDGFESPTITVNVSLLTPRDERR